MTHNNSKSLKRTAFTLPVLTAFFACSTTEPETAELPAKASGPIAEFVQDQITNNWSNISRVGARVPLQMFVRVGPATDPDVCTTGESYGPFTVEDDSVSGGGKVTANQPTLRLANLGDLSICTIITSPVNASIDIDADTLYMRYDECEHPPAAIAGTWEGNYSCTSTCGDETGFVSLTILQDSYSATYTDSSASYEGTVCGNVFKFSGGGTGYRESGTFVLNSAGSASKTSEFRYTDNSCSGACSDPNLIQQ